MVVHDETATGSSEREKGGVEFLRADFSECYRQMCHYDGQIIDVCKFAFLGYSTLAGLAIGLYKFGVEKNVNLVLAAATIIALGLVVGVLIFTLVIRNRVYFVRVTRYVNEIRDHFLENKPLGFENRSGMYTDWRQPPYFNLWSSQLLASYMIAFFNSALLGVLLYLAKVACAWIGILSVAVFFSQIGFGVQYLKRSDGKSAEEAAFGKRSKQIERDK